MIGVSFCSVEVYNFCIMTKPLPKCPDCGKKFQSVKLIAMHRSRVHGYVGMAPSTVAARARRARLAAAKLPASIPVPSIDSLPITNPCSDCGQDFASPQLLGRHRKLEHGTISVTEQKRLARLNMDGGLPCSHCDFIAANKAGLSLHVNKQHPHSNAEDSPLEQPTTQNARVIVRSTPRLSHTLGNEQASADGIPEATLALALGRFQGLCASMAHEFDLPTRSFAARLAQLIYATQVR